MKNLAKIQMSPKHVLPPSNSLTCETLPSTLDLLRRININVKYFLKLHYGQQNHATVMSLFIVAILDISTKLIMMQMNIVSPLTGEGGVGSAQ